MTAKLLEAVCQFCIDAGIDGAAQTQVITLSEELVRMSFEMGRRVQANLDRAPQLTYSEALDAAAREMDLAGVTSN